MTDFPQGKTFSYQNLKKRECMLLVWNKQVKKVKKRFAYT